jgi:hypothetical protein
MLYPQGFEPEEIETGLWKLPPGDFADYHLDILSAVRLPIRTLNYLIRFNYSKNIKSRQNGPIKIVYTFSPENETNLEAHACYLALALRLPDIEWLCLCDNVAAYPKVYPTGHPWPSNVWLGTTVNSQKDATSKLKILSYMLAPVRFVLITKPSGGLTLRNYLSRSKNIGINWVIETKTVGGAEENIKEAKIYEELNNGLLSMKTPVPVFIRDFAKSDDESVGISNKSKITTSPRKDSISSLLDYNWFCPVHTRKENPFVFKYLISEVAPVGLLCYGIIGPGPEPEPLTEEEKEELKDIFRTLGAMTGR